MTEENELTFPIQGAEKCPHCGCKDRIGERIIRELKELGKIAEDSFGDGIAWRVPLVDIQSAAQMLSGQVPMIEIYYDVCAECFTVYATVITMGILAGGQRAPVSAPSGANFPKGTPNFPGFVNPHGN